MDDSELRHRVREAQAAPRVGLQVTAEFEGHGDDQREQWRKEMQERAVPPLSRLSNTNRAMLQTEEGRERKFRRDGYPSPGRP